ncbi:MAG: Hpt domain-containing protein [Desulfobacula sp.]|nr:Hpt domain-containing protein [Desulfobacula sp.]
MEFLKELLGIFKADCPGRLTEMSRAIKEKDFKVLKETAHALRGRVGNLGLTSLYELLYKLEKMGRAENIDGTDEVLKEVEKEIERFNNFISTPGWEEK